MKSSEIETVSDRGLDDERRGRAKPGRDVRSVVVGQPVDDSRRQLVHGLRSPVVGVHQTLADWAVATAVERRGRSTSSSRYETTCGQGGPFTPRPLQYR